MRKRGCGKELPTTDEGGKGSAHRGGHGGMKVVAMEVAARGVAEVDKEYELAARGPGHGGAHEEPQGEQRLRPRLRWSDGPEEGAGRRAMRHVRSCE